MPEGMPVKGGTYARPAGGVVQDDAQYSGGVRQELHRLAGEIKQEDFQILDGRVGDYVQRVLRSRWVETLPEAGPLKPVQVSPTQERPAAAAPLTGTAWRPTAGAGASA